MKSSEYVLTWVYGEMKITEKLDFENDYRALDWVMSRVRAYDGGPNAIALSAKEKDGLRMVLHLIL